ncbi:MAG: restriction endonuclease subunit S [Acidobacteriia bacterium]|nr:restriction endonuclease subunit S [Terriglobia bacterium]
MRHLDWVDGLPDQWEAKPLRATAGYVVSNVDKVPAECEMPVRLCNYTDVYNNEFITLALDFMQSTASEDEIRKFKLLVDDVVITKDSESWDDIGVPAHVRETAGDLVCGYHLALLRPHKQRVDGAFLFRCLQAKPIRVQLELAANGVTRFGIPKSEIGAMMLPVPPLRQQRIIADYLDRETARLDGLVAAKERVLGLLAEKRRALVTRAVTRGFDPRAPLRYSGIPWLGEIPIHWELKRAKWLFRERDERSTTGEETLLSLRMELGLVPHNEVSEKQTRAEELIGYKKTSLNEIVLNRMRAASGLVAVSPKDGLVSPDYAVFQAAPDTDPRYFAHLFRTELLQAVFRSESTGLGTGSSGFLRLYSENFLSLWLPCPSYREQRSILEHVANETARLDALRAATERTIALLKERRAALIAAAVTGRIDLQGVGHENDVAAVHDDRVLRRQ